LVGSHFNRRSVRLPLEERGTHMTEDSSNKTGQSRPSSLVRTVLVTLSVRAGVTITATGILVCEVAGDITINGNLVGDCVARLRALEDDSRAGRRCR
jgi:hypothetical protein